ncbi:vegetative cell wall protein gp1-like [Olea europaea var. sylvestris]|uniref:vegetative cell wall protein gp1-like n=1 Tax=Olea europaea var. sylvestris TaxID=158386 RepID=UPI000C1D8102|nr:vegetative cell wall protein gp1-like [Olea europaea var. sylvestris]
MAKIIITILFLCLYVCNGDRAIESDVGKMKNGHQLMAHGDDCRSLAHYSYICGLAWGGTDNADKTILNTAFDDCCDAANRVSYKCIRVHHHWDIYYLQKTCNYASSSCLKAPAPSPLIIPSVPTSPTPIPQPPSVSPPPPTPEQPSPIPQPPPTPGPPSPISVSPSPSPIPQPPPTPAQPSPISVSPSPSPIIQPPPTPEQPSPAPQPSPDQPPSSPPPTPGPPSPISVSPSPSPIPQPSPISVSPSPSPIPQPPPTPEQPSPISVSPSPSPIPQPPPTPEQPSPAPQPSPDQPPSSPPPTPNPLVPPPPPPNHPIRPKNCLVAVVRYDSCDPKAPDTSHSLATPYEKQFIPSESGIAKINAADCCVALSIIDNKCDDLVKDMSYAKLREFYRLEQACSSPYGEEART